MQCEICGREGTLFRTKIENAEMDVCERCSKFGKVLREIKLKKDKIEKVVHRKNKMFCIRKDYNIIIKKNREKIGLKQGDLAKKMNLKESILHKIESGSIEPSMELAKKFEKFFKIKLIENYEEEREEKLERNNEEITIGDLLKEKIKY